MESINNLADLLMYNVQNLYAAEQHAKQAIPAIIDKVHHSSLKNALTHHFKLTDEQIKRLERIPQMIKEKAGEQNIHFDEVIKSNLTCKGMSGLINEANELLQKDLSADVTDAAIIECVQKMEHYEISVYGTALAYAKQMHLHEVENLLNETLQEEYDADDLLTSLAIAALNKEAIPEGMQVKDENAETGSEDIEASRPVKVSISERTINSPGGRAGTSHRRYGSGESRGH